MGFLILFIFMGSSAIQANAQDRPNILWITCEDISPNLGCYGDTYAHTPHLDQLAERGVLYRNAFATAPVCAVARSSIISGMYASSQGSQHMRCKARRPEGMKMYPELLRAAGYYCTNNSKTDYNFDMDPKSIWDQCGPNAHWRNRSEIDRPFFSIFNFGTSHESRVNGEQAYLAAIKQVPAELLKKPGDIPLPPYFPDTDVTRSLWARYYNIITAMDMQVEDILRQLEEDGMRDQTIVIFYSDHGAGIPRHKRWLFDTGIQVPWIVSVPEKYQHWLPHNTGSQTRELVSFIDLPPTALHLAGIPIPDYMEGRAFMGSNLSPQRKYIYAGRDRMDERYDMQRCVRDDRYKYIRYYEPYLPLCQYMNTPEKGGIMQAIRRAHNDGTLPEAGVAMMATSKPKEVLYDCHLDPYELTDLANDPSHQKILERLRAAHARWSDETNDTGLLPETILGDWEEKYEMAIYDIMRSKSIPVKEIRETALAEMTISELQGQLKHENSAVRYWAAINLGNQADKITDRAVVESTLADPVAVVRFATARALHKLGQTHLAIPVLTDGLLHDDEWVRLNAAQILDEMDQAAKPAIKALQSVMEDPNKYVVRVANHAINNMLGTSREVR